MPLAERSSPSNIAKAATLKAAEYMYSQAFPQVTLQISCTVHWEYLDEFINYQQNTVMLKEFAEGNPVHPQTVSRLRWFQYFKMFGRKELQDVQVGQ